jgi:RNA polymerase sigma-70 factor (ECF subfamily)
MGRVVNLAPEFSAQELDQIEACRKGDRRALQAVFLAHSPYLERLLGRVVGSALEVEDLLQSTFLAAIHAFPRFRGEARVRTWLARIAIRIAQERLRSASHRRRGELPDLEDSVDPRALLDVSESGVDSRRRVVRLNHHLQAISPKKRIAFVLHVFEGLPIEEVAALTAASVTATKSRVFWARRELIKRAQRDPILREIALEAVP